MRTWSFYDPATGRFTGRTFTGPPSALAVNARGLAAIAGEYDRESQRVENGIVVDYQPPAPSPEHEWDSVSKRWRLPLAQRQAIVADHRARAAIAGAEAGTLRALREALLSPAIAALMEREAPQALATLRAADSSIAASRGALLKKGADGGRG